MKKILEVKMKRNLKEEKTFSRESFFKLLLQRIFLIEENEFWKWNFSFKYEKFFVRVVELEERNEINSSSRS